MAVDETTQRRSPRSETSDRGVDVQETLAAFVPQLAIELAAAQEASHTEIDGSMLSADISGFTALSEKLAGKGKAGAEEITELINQCFTALIDAAYQFGGEVLKFGGDALLVLFRDNDHQRRSAAAGLAMQAALRTSSAAKRAALSMTVGVAEGPFDLFLVGSDYREMLVMGHRSSEVIRLEASAAKGDTLVSKSIAAQLPASARLREQSGGWVIEGDLPIVGEGPRLRTIVDSDLRSLVPIAVQEQLSAFADLGGEHRLVTVGFLMVTGVEALIESAGVEQATAALHHLVDEVVAACAESGVTMLHTDIAPDGAKFVMCAGAPVNPGDTGDAMLHASIRVAAIESPLVLRQGVQTGRVFAGFLGSSYRRTYTLMGDPVNTAARMLGKADDRDVVAVETVVADTRTVFVTEQLEPFLVKGKSEPIVAHKVRGASDSVRRDASRTQLLGRQSELETIASAIGNLGEVVVLTGPAGVGKSRLLDAAWDLSEGLRAFQGSCTPYGAASPYSAFRPLLRGGCGFDVNADPLLVGRLLRVLINDQAPELLPMLPLLAVPFGAEVAATPEANAIDPQYRRERIHDVVVQFLDALLDGPAFLVMEDVHWIDQASGELLTHVVRLSEARPWTAVLTRRPQGSWELPEDLAHVRTIELAPLDEAAIESIVVEVSARPLSDVEVTAVVERSGGNPLFAIELARSVGSAGEVAELPDSVEALISTRIDSLPPEQRRLVRVAAVFGQEFDLVSIEAVATGAASIGDELDDMIERKRGRQYRFRHAMYRDAAYEGLPFRQRKELHSRVAHHLRDAATNPDDLGALLSLHFARARLHREAFRYASVAAERAAAAYAHTEAAELYDRALVAGRYCRDVDDAKRSHLLVEMGRSLEFAGELDRADGAYGRVARYTDDADVRVECLRRRARVRQKQSRMSAAVRLLVRARRALDELPTDARVERRRAEIHLNLAGIRMDQGRLGASLAEAEQALEHAQRAGDDQLRVQAYGAIVGATTDWSVAEQYVELGLGPSAPAEAHEARSILAINLGMAAFFAGRWSAAVEFYEQGRVSAEAMGNVTAGALAAMNAAEVLVDQGRYEQAIEALDPVRRVLGAAGYHAALLYADLLFGTATMRSGSVADGERLLAACADEFRSGSMLLYALEADVRVIECRLRDGDLVTAGDLALRALEEADQVARSAVITTRAMRLGGISALLGEDRTSARALLAEAIATCRAEGLRYELAVTLVPMAEVDDTVDPAEADLIFDELGVVESGRPHASSAWLPGESAG